MSKRSPKKKNLPPELIRSPWIYFLFLFSGIASLIYQVVWVRMLTLVFGHTIYSVSIVLSAFMAGLGLGSYLWGRTIDKTGKPLLIYGKIEILIGISAALLSVLLSSFSPIYAWLHQFLSDLFFLATILKAVLAFLLVLIPTLFMGATLPVTCKYFATEDANLGQQVGYLYSVNTLGAAAGCLFAGYFLIGFFGVLETALIAAGINLLIGLVCIAVFKKAEPEVACGFGLPKPASFSFQLDKVNSLWLTISFICGFTALAYEVVWTRLLVFGIGSTVYSFSLMLANFLFGITVGGLLIVPFFKKKINFRLLLTFFQFGIGLYLIFSLYQSTWLLSSFIRVFKLDSPITEFWINMRHASALMFVPTVLFGMSFPILTHLVTKGSKDIGSSLGAVYATNTLGGIMGSIVAGYLLLPNLGSQQTLVCLAMLNFLTGMLLFVRSSLFTGFIRKGAAVSLSCLILLFLLKMPNDLLKGIFLRNSSGKVNPEQLIYLDEGLTTTVAVFDDYNNELMAKRLILNGVNMSASIINSRKYMTLLSYIPLLLTENPKNVLVICFGTGQTAGAAGAYPGINLVDAVDISPGVFRAGKFFEATNHNVVNNPKVNKINQDGRQHLLTTSTVYDVITAEPPPPTSAGSVNLYTREYYELTKRSLKPGGIVSQWIPLHSQSEAHIYENFRTFLESFPYVMAWYPAYKELILVGSNQPININFQSIEERLQNRVIKNILGDIGFGTPNSFLGSIWFLKNELKRLSAGQRIISDNHPTLEYFLGDAKQIAEDGVTRITESRSSFEGAFEKITQSSYFLSNKQKATFKKHWDGRPKTYYAITNYNRGVALENKGKISEAISHYKMAIKLNPDFAKGHYGLAHILQVEGKNSQAISHYKIAVKLNPDFGLAHSNLGVALSSERKIEAAISSLKTAIELMPDFPLAYFNLADALESKGKISKAISHYKRAIELKPDYYVAHNNLGNALRKKGNTNEAITHYRIAIKIKPDFALAYNNLGNTLSLKGNTNEAISYLKTAIELKPDFTQAHYNLGVVLLKNGNTSEAISHYKIAIKSKPNFPEVYNNLGILLMGEHKTDEAIHLFRKSIKLQPDFILAQKNLEIALSKKEKSRGLQF
jgi:spermidine synthase